MDANFYTVERQMLDLVASRRADADARQRAQDVSRLGPIPIATRLGRARRVALHLVGR